MKKTVVISLGGSLIVPDDGIDVMLLKKFRALILRHVRRGTRFVIVTGGGTVCRQYQHALRALGIRATTELDWIGIRVSRLNAHLVRSLFGKDAVREIVTDPHVVTRTTFDSHHIILAGGEKPGQSTDQVAVELAIRFGAKTIINLSNIRYVYDRDPRKYRDAKPMHAMTWTALKKLVGTQWTPGANVPFDPRATRAAAAAHRTLSFLHGGDMKNLARCLAGQQFDGTIVQ